jgi:phosphoenolpyruvate carboxylase
MATLPKIARFNENVLLKYQIYNSILMNLPFPSVHNTGALLPLFYKICEEGYKQGKNPTEIVSLFIQRYVQNSNDKDNIDLLFHFIQYIEREVVLFDAIEDAAFPIVNNMEGVGTLRSAKEIANSLHKLDELKEHLKTFKVRLVLTAHPTQFYPGTVLGIITDLDHAIEKNDIVRIEKLLAQLGKTPFFKKKKPTPFDEAVSLIWYLENVFYHSATNIYNYIQQNIFEEESNPNEILNLGFWPGGDRDGNPFVTTKITLDVAERLRQSIFKNYYKDIRKLKRRLTFKGVEEIITKLEKSIHKHSIKKVHDDFTVEHLKSKLLKVRELLITKHQSLFLEELDDFINKIKLFGFYFATLDIRQDSRVHHKAFMHIVETIQYLNNSIFPENYTDLSEKEQIKVLSNIKGNVDPSVFDEKIVKETLESMYAMREIQSRNGEKGANRYIISNNQTALNVMETFAMLNLCGFGNTLPVDIIPLFETVTDLKNADKVMRTLYSNKAYAKHLADRNKKQTIMLGFSDGTKDGGYLKANWSIFKAKEALTKVSREFRITVIFFDGRGGPPARGGGKTHQFYASLGSTIENEEIQLTVQGQTISSNFGTLHSSQYNMEQLISSGIKNEVVARKQFTEEQRKIMEDLAEISYQAYQDFKNHPKFISYLEEMSTLKYYGKANIGSRPSRRSASKELVFSDLRAIPFVGSWSQLKQNVPGFYGVGSALAKYEEKGELDKIIKMYQDSDFFKTLLENSMMSLKKSFFELTAYMANDPNYGDFWKLIYNEYQTSKRLLLKVSGLPELMANDPVGKASIEVRENIVLPLLTIQQFALRKIQELKKDPIKNKKEIEIYEKMVTRSLFGNINAGRNSA